MRRFVWPHPQSPGTWTGGAAFGGGIFHGANGLSLLNATVTENVAQGGSVFGGGVYNGGPTVSQDSILTGNTGGTCWISEIPTANGTNLADDVAADSVLEIPTLGTWALGLLALALAPLGALRIQP